LGNPIVGTWPEGCGHSLISKHFQGWTLRQRDRQDVRLLIFVVVILCHVSILLLVTRVARVRISFSMARNEPLILVPVAPTQHLPREPPQPNRAATQRVPVAKPRGLPPDQANPTNEAPAAPKIDWANEADLAAQNAMARAAAEENYRNLSGLSADQLKWVRENELVPAEPGIPWKYRRVEITEGGFPIIHINDHCIAVPLLLMMVFCKIGHIEPNGDLFEHLRDPPTP
jgi:hypothetical protein